MASFNKVILMGNLTRDPEVRTTQSGQTVTELGLATNRTYTVGGKDGQSGEKREEVAFIDVSFWGRAGELIAQHLKKGDPILLEGRLAFRQWVKDGEKRSKLSVTGESFHFLGGRREGSPGKAEGAASQGTLGAPSPEDWGDEVPF